MICLTWLQDTRIDQWIWKPSFFRFAFRRSVRAWGCGCGCSCSTRVSIALRRGGTRTPLIWWLWRGYDQVVSLQDQSTVDLFCFDLASKAFYISFANFFRPRYCLHAANAGSSCRWPFRGRRRNKDSVARASARAHLSVKTLLRKFRCGTSCLISRITRKASECVASRSHDVW